MLLSVDRSQTDSTQSLSFEVIAAIAEKEGVDPTDIEPPEYQSLYDAINPEALDSLFAPRVDGTTRTNGRVEFTFCEYHISVTSDGNVVVRDEQPDHE
ncbi:HalOD1 output domain-containing protein [Natrialbaceae archaeon A-arb3/5]